MFLRIYFYKLFFFFCIDLLVLVRDLVALSWIQKTGVWTPVTPSNCYRSVETKPSRSVATLCMEWIQSSCLAFLLTFLSVNTE